MVDIQAKAKLGQEKRKPAISSESQRQEASPRLEREIKIIRMNPNEKDQLIQSLQTQIQELQTKLEDYSQGGIKILFSGKANAQRVARKVKPRTLREMPELSVGSEEQKTKNLVIEGDNLLALSTLYQYHDQDPNDPGLGDYVKADDPSRSEYEERDLKDGYAPALVLKASEDFSLPELGSISLPFTESGHSQAGVRELNAATGYSDDNGTTGHAVLQLNKETGSDRSFILIESGNPENGDNYCRTLLQKRLQAAITAHEPLGGGFKFTTLDKQINNQAILQMERTELIDTIIASRIDKYQQKYQGLQLLKSENCRYLIAKNSNQEGFFLIWDGPNQNVNFTKEVYQSVVQEAQENNLRPPYHVYARLYLCQTERVIFHQIPNSILLDFGFDLEKDQFN
ncbi:6534_t:CDS:2 [Gigaspora margarita]|uniref:6534_t:CDS:1 n=1 Tax=Gigaspora margarita TaxID=4874 RepID=A0ABN7UCX8_GIGMA|nr:6534_t:CDS:2 [Gigaspora margarita]